MHLKSLVFFPAIAALGLAACAPNPNAYPGDPNARTRTGAVTGAVIGGLLGATTGSGDRFGRALVGGAVGAAAGGLIGGALDKQAADLRQQLGNDNISVTNTGTELLVSMPQDILFATDSAALRPDLQRDLGAVANNLLQYPRSRVEVIGHTDNTGSSAHNLDLSQRRAQAVADILVQSGVPGSRLTATGRGEDEPIATNLTAAGRAQNRRVEIHIHPTS